MLFYSHTRHSGKEWKIYGTEKIIIKLLFLLPTPATKTLKISHRLFISVFAFPAINLRKFLMRFALRCNWEKNEITMGKAFVSYFPFSSSFWLCSPSRGWYFHFAIVSTRQQLYFHFLLCWAISPCRMRQAAQLDWSVCSGELNFNPTRVIRALRAPSGYGFHLGIWARVEVTSENNNFGDHCVILLALAAGVPPAPVFAFWFDSPL